MAEPIEMPFGLKTQVSLRNYVLDGVQILSHARVVRWLDHLDAMCSRA